MYRNVQPDPGQRHQESFDETQSQGFKRQMRMEMDKAGLSQKVVALSLPMDQAQLSRCMSEGHRDHFPAHRLIDWTREVGPGLLRYIALRTGRDLCSIEQTQSCDECPQRMLSLLARTSGDCLATLIQQFHDNSWTPEERVAARPGLQKLVTIASALLEQANAGGAN